MDRCGHQINATERRVKQTEETRTGSCDDSCRLNCFEARRGGCPHPPGGAKLRKTASCCSRPDEGVRAYVIVIDLDLKRRNTMKAISVFPGKPNSVHVAELPKPSVDQIPNGRGVLVRVLRVGVDGTDKEIDAAEYGQAPPGYDFLIIGDEGFGRVEAVGPNVTAVKPGDYVVATVRRPGSSIYDLIGTNDMTTDDTYFERGINLRHGYLTEYYVDDSEFIVKVPQGLKEVGVLLEPTTVVEKGIYQAYEIQRRMKVWRPQRAAVMGAGTIGLLATLVLRLRGLEVTTFGRTERPYLNSDLIEAIGARYITTVDTPILDAANELGPFDLIFEATGNSSVVFESMQALAKNGVLVLSSVTGGDRMITVPAD